MILPSTPLHNPQIATQEAERLRWDIMQKHAQKTIREDVCIREYENLLAWTNLYMTSYSSGLKRFDGQ